jgi:catechol 2,3-dioxygenase-like lactoylglutathione lyase family enzyme
MFDHVTIRVTSRSASEAFYGKMLSALGIEMSYTGDEFSEWDDFSLSQATASKPATGGLHIGVAAPSRAHVDEFWRLGRADGYEDAGAPGERPHYKPDYYGAFLLDPDGNSVEAVHHGSLRRGGVIDHVWLRAAELEDSRRFYGVIAPHAGFELRDLSPEHVQLVGTTGSFSVVAGEPTRNLHMAFPAASNAAVDEFHREARRAGYRDDGPPGERPEYHPGYYGAFVLDPDGNSIEVVNHNRTAVA